MSTENKASWSTFQPVRSSTEACGRCAAIALSSSSF
eukprot:CAMPEP_0202110468 /NCGR_PEP_ID=MMETSP0965-20130614/26662_1 /ASSEMBLY_ACC=CAM_ASM_000507 /TAXON_ID=4773 /ORGANISM="Schizochytrium aggregatum, Strain ATCC28209" /LENGTH=35 /DNA_ID= /DNA_START= /DNA_END= /DNA_ORIENTATION=